GGASVRRAHRVGRDRRVPGELARVADANRPRAALLPPSPGGGARPRPLHDAVRAGPHGALRRLPAALPPLPDALPPAARAGRGRPAVRLRIRPGPTRGANLRSGRAPLRAPPEAALRAADAAARGGRPPALRPPANASPAFS